MIAIKRLLLNVIIGVTFIAHAFLHILPDPPYTATAFVLIKMKSLASLHACSQGSIRILRTILKLVHPVQQQQKIQQEFYYTNGIYHYIAMSLAVSAYRLC